MKSITTICVESVPLEDDQTGDAKYGLTRSDFDRIVKTIPGIQQAVPIREMNKRRAGYSERLAEVRLVGTTPPFFETHKMAVERGRFLVDRDVKMRENVAVIGCGVAEWLFPRIDPIGKNIHMEDAYYLVVGVIARGGGPQCRAPASGDGDPDREVYIPLTTMRARLGDMEIMRQAGSIESNHCELSRIEIIVPDIAHVRRIFAAIGGVLRESHENRDYTITSDSKLKWYQP